MFRSLQNGWVLFAILFSLIVIVPIATVGSFVFINEGDTWLHLKETVLLNYITNSLVIALCVFIFSVIIGTITAWIISMFNFPCCKYIDWLLILPLAIPSYALCYVYSETFGFNGFFSQMFQWLTNSNSYLVNFYSIEGAIFIFTFSLYPYVYILARQSFISQSASYIEISKISGHNLVKIFFKNSIPYARPAIIGGATLVIMETLADYGVADYLGIDTFTKGIYRTWFNLGDINSAGKLSSILLLTVFFVIFIERTSRRKAKYNKNIRNDRPLIKRNLSGFNAYLAITLCLIPVFLGFFIPLITLISWCFKSISYWDLYSFIKIIFSSFSIAFIAAILCMACAIIIVYGLRVNYKFVSPFARIASMGYSIPGAVAAIGILIPIIWMDNNLNIFFSKYFNYSTGLLLSGSLAALLFAYLIRFLALSIQSVENAFIRVPSSLDNAAKVLGATNKNILKNILIKLNINGICLGILVVFVDILKELPATIILRPYDFSTLAIKAHELAMDERLYEASLPLITIIFVCLCPLFVINKITTKYKREN